MLRSEPMTPLDKRCIRALQGAGGMSANASRITASLGRDLRLGNPITLRMRHALYAIAWRFRRQLDVGLQVKVAIASADAHMMALLCQPEEPPRIRAFRVVDNGASTPPRNPLDDLFSNQGAGA